MSTVALILCLLFAHVPTARVYDGVNVGVTWGLDADCQHGNLWEVVGDPGMDFGNTEC